MKLSIIVSYYKNLSNLKLILQGFEVQSTNGFEVIISEDDYNEETISFVQNEAENYSFTIQHLHQKADAGFRKNEMLNRSILAAKADLIAFIDGDCIPHRHFVKAYIKNQTEKAILSGRRVMLGEALSKEMLASNSIKKLSILQVLKSDSKLKKEAIYSPLFSLGMKVRGLLGCNWAVQKKYLLQVNGFDEDYQSPGVGEDVDIEWRLESIGLTKKLMKNKSIVYHLYHERSYAEEGVQNNYKLLKEKKSAELIVCKNGIEKNFDSKS